jgi:hypothetical protein
MPRNAQQPASLRLPVSTADISCTQGPQDMFPECLLTDEGREVPVRSHTVIVSLFMCLTRKVGPVFTESVTWED